jgi:hypothetical protein
MTTAFQLLRRELENYQMQSIFKDTSKGRSRQEVPSPSCSRSSELRESRDRHDVEGDLQREKPKETISCIYLLASLVQPATVITVNAIATNHVRL